MDENDDKAIDQALFKMTRKVAAERRARIVAILKGFPETATAIFGVVNVVLVTRRMS
jgi:hypothetical protein